MGVEGQKETGERGREKECVEASSCVGWSDCYRTLEEGREQGKGTDGVVQALRPGRCVVSLFAIDRASC